MKASLIGAGGHASDVLDVAVRAGWEIVGAYADTSPDTDRLGRCGVDVLGPISPEVAAPYLLAIGYPKPRVQVAARLEGAAAAGPLVDPSAMVAPSAGLADDVIVFWQAAVSPLVTIEAHSFVSYGATVGHDSTIGEFVSVMPGARISGGVSIGDGVLIGTGSVVLEDRTIGPGAVVGAGAVVVGDVPAGVTVIGSPAKPR